MKKAAGRVSSCSLTSNTKQWHFLNAPLVQFPASSLVSFIVLICEIHRLEWIGRLEMEMEKSAVASSTGAWQESRRRTWIKLVTLQGWTPAPLSYSSDLSPVCLQFRLFCFSLSSPLPNTQPSCSASAPPLRGQLLAVTSERRDAGNGRGILTHLITGLSQHTQH